MIYGQNTESEVGSAVEFNQQSGSKRKNNQQSLHCSKHLIVTLSAISVLHYRLHSG